MRNIHPIVRRRPARAASAWPAEPQKDEAHFLGFTDREYSDPYAERKPVPVERPEPLTPILGEYAGMPVDHAEFTYALAEKQRRDITRIIPRPAFLR